MTEGYPGEAPRDPITHAVFNVVRSVEDFIDYAVSRTVEDVIREQWYQDIVATPEESVALRDLLGQLVWLGAKSEPDKQDPSFIDSLIASIAAQVKEEECGDAMVSIARVAIPKGIALQHGILGREPWVREWEADHRAATQELTAGWPELPTPPWPNHDDRQ